MDLFDYARTHLHTPTAARVYEQQKDVATPPAGPSPAVLVGRGSKVTDFGEAIAGARKDAYRFSAAEIAAMSTDEIQLLAASQSDRRLTKGTIWPRPDATAYREEGKSPLLYTVHLAAWKGLGASPHLYRDRRGQVEQITPAILKSYAFMIANARDFVTSCTSVSDLLGKLRRLQDRTATENREHLKRNKIALAEGRHYAFPGDIDVATNEIFFGHVCTHDAGSFVGVNLPGNGGLVASRLICTNGKTHRAFPTKFWCESLHVVASQNPDVSWDQIQPSASPLHKSSPVDSPSHGENAENLADRARLAYFGARAAPPPEARGENGRTGMPLWRKVGTIVGEEDVLRVFGLRGGQFGNWVPQKERAAFLDATYDAFLDLSHILGIPAHGISLGGTLGMAWGARGRGNYAAHFEPGEMVANLTRTSGPGSLAHEWAHALDHVLYKSVGDCELTRTSPLPYISEAITAPSASKSTKISGGDDVVRATAAVFDFIKAAKTLRLADADEPLPHFVESRLLPKADFLDRFLNKVEVANCLLPNVLRTDDLHDVLAGASVATTETVKRRGVIEDIACDIMYNTLTQALCRTYRDTGLLIASMASDRLILKHLNRSSGMR